MDRNGHTSRYAAAGDCAQAAEPSLELLDPELLEPELDEPELELPDGFDDESAEPPDDPEDPDESLLAAGTEAEDPLRESVR